MSSHQKVELTADGAKYSDVILIQLCKLMKQNVPLRNSCDIVDKIFIKIADKTAACMMEFIECSVFRNLEQCELDSECINEHLNSNYPVEDCYPQEIEEAESEYEDASENLAQSFEASSSSIPEPLIEKEKMSFLSLSKVIVDQKYCHELLDQFENIQEEMAKQAVQKSTKKAARAAKRQVEKDKKNKKDDCLGDVNKKPQWQVEWVDKASKQAHSSIA